MTLRVLLLCLCVVTPCAADPVRVLAAVTLKPALEAIAKDFHGALSLIYGPSPTLAKQVENGLPADMFFSADKLWMDELAQKQLIKPGTITNLISNHLVLIARKGTAERATITPGFAIAQLVGAGPLVMCDPDSHPAGRYGKASLIKLGAWQGIEQKVASVENPLIAVKMVARGDAPIAIVFATDAATDPGVEIIGTFPDDTHPKIRYPVAILVESRNPDAVRLLDHLRSPAALSVFRKLGYVILGSGN